MRLMLFSTAVTAAFATAGAALAADAAPAAPPAGIAAPPAPIFYCPAPAAGTPAAPARPALSAGAGCPTVAGVGHGGVHRARHVSRSRIVRQRRMATSGSSSVTLVNRDNEEDNGVSASQAWAYRYEMERGGLHPWEVEGDRYQERGDDSHDYAWRDQRGARDWSQHAPPPTPHRDDCCAAVEDDSGYAQTWSGHEEQQDERGEGERDHHHHHHHHHDADRDDKGGDGGYQGGEEHHFAYERRERDDTGGSVRGSVDGDRYGYAWGDRQDAQRDERDERRSGEEMHAYAGEGAYGGEESHGYSDSHERLDRDAGGYAHHSGGGFSYSEESGGSSSSRSYGEGDVYAGDRYGAGGGYGFSYGSGAYATDGGVYASGGDRYGWTGEPAHGGSGHNGQDGGYNWRYGQGGGYEVYDYAGRDERGYLVWSGKPRR